MKRKIFLAIFFTGLSICPVSLLAQENSNQSLLWRISGHGLTVPSYLFGTMHVKNRKAFYFKDSLYRFIEQASGFAMEIHPDSLSQIITAYAEGRLNFDFNYPGQDDKFNEKEFDKVFEKIKNDLTLSKKSPKEKLNYLTEKMLDSKTEDENGMDTFMDAFLFGLARQNGKKIFGLEQVEDQIRAFGYLSYGIRYNKVPELLDKWDIRTSSPIYHYYYKEQLDSICRFYKTYFSDSSLKGFLYDRNIVMAHQMDSLMQKQTLFTAIGAGHLPGKEGVIELLRGKGYLVEPVNSSHKIFAGDYTVKPIADNWITGKSEIFGFQYQMPGKITNQLADNGKEVTYHYDLVAGMMFMTVSGRLTSSEKKKKTDSVFNDQLERMLLAVNGMELSRKKIEIRGMKGFEAVANAGMYGYMRITELFDGNNYYVLTLSAEKKDKLNSEKAERFINSISFFPLNKPEWTVMHSKKDGFAVSFPGIPHAVPATQKEESNVSMNAYRIFDGTSGINYSVYFSKAKPGNTLYAGEVFFNSYLQNLKENTGDEEMTLSDTMINGYPAKKFRSAPFEDKIMEGIILRRNNASYFVSAEFDEAEMNNEELRKFFQSFVLVPFPETVWKRTGSPDGDFTTWAPGDMVQLETDSSYAVFSEPATNFYAFDDNQAISYTVDVKQISSYYWAPNEDSVYNFWKDRTVSVWSDSVLNYAPVSNGGITGREIISINKYNKSKSRYRLLLNGRKMYILGYVMDETAPDDTNSDHFFSQFHLKNEERVNDIFTTKPEKLFNDLQSKDSTTFAHAYASLNEINFLPQQFHELMEKALLEYPAYENTYLTVNEKLIMAANNMVNRNEGDAEWLAGFIREHYLLPGNAVAAIRYQLLGMLAGRRTAASYHTIKELLAARLPAGNDSYRLFGKLNDSLLLTKMLYPDLLKYITDTSNGMSILSLTKTLIDRNYLDTSVLKPVLPELLQVAGRKIQQVSKPGADEHDYDYELLDFITLLGYLRQKSTDDKIAEFLKTKAMSLKHCAAVALLQNGKPVSTTEIKKIAADHEYRAAFYEELKKKNKTGLFPSEFATQQYMGMSYVYKRIMEDEDEYEQSDELHLIYIKKIEQDYQGTKKRFFLFRVNFGGGDVYVSDTLPPGQESYLAIAGPFDTDSKKIILGEKENISGIYYDRRFDGAMNDEYFKKYMAPFLKEEKK